MDYSTINNVDWPVYFAELKAAGRDFIGRYLPVEGAMWRRVTPAELDAATAAGIDYFFWFQNSTALRCLDGFAAGVEDAQEALLALDSLDLPATTPVYYTVDMNLGDGSAIDGYFLGINSVVPVAQVGVYGNYTAIDWVYQRGLATYFCQTNAWSDPRGWHPQARMHQDVTQHMIGGVYVDRLTVTAADLVSAAAATSPTPASSAPAPGRPTSRARLWRKLRTIQDERGHGHHRLHRHQPGLDRHEGHHHRHRGRVPGWGEEGHHQPGRLRRLLPQNVWSTGRPGPRESQGADRPQRPAPPAST